MTVKMTSFDLSEIFCVYETHLPFVSIEVDYFCIQGYVVQLAVCMKTDDTLLFSIVSPKLNSLTIAKFGAEN